MAALGQTQQPGLAQVLPGPGPAELSPFLPSPTSPLPSVLPRSKPSQQCWLLRSLEGRQNPPPPAAWLCDPGQLAPAPWALWALSTGTARADVWAPAFSVFDLILAA